MMVNTIYKIIFFLLLTSPLLFSMQTVDNLLEQIKNNTDLSEETKLENSGIATIYTRQDLERMQVKVLKDILKTSAFFKYAENRFGISDPLTNGTAVPSMSSLIKLYIDDQEITSGIYGSGITILGDISLEFVDHIEVYTQSTTYENSIEPALMLIKLYSKTATKDSGSKLSILTDNYGTIGLSGYTIDNLDNDWSYMLYASGENLKREKINELSRDSKKGQVFFRFKNDNQNLQFLATKRSQDAFIGISQDGKVIDNNLNGTSLHLGYNATIDNFSFLLSYEYLERKYHFKNNMFVLDNALESQLVTTELQYKKNLDKHQFIIGVKNRFKYYDTTVNKRNNKELPSKLNKAQSIFALFLEEQYSVLPNLIVTGGTEFLKVQNINAIYNKESTPFLYRYGLTYVKDRYKLKIIGSSTQSYLEPYLIDSNIVVEGPLDNFKSKNLFAEFEYKKSDITYNVIVVQIRTTNYLYPDMTQGGKLKSYKNNVKANILTLKTEYNYREYDKLKFSVSLTDITNHPLVDKQRGYKANIVNLNSYKKYDFYEELVYCTDNVTKEQSYDVSLGLRYHTTEDFSISVKGENLLNNAKEMKYPLQDPKTSLPQGMLSVQTIDRKVLFSLEYLF